MWMMEPFPEMKNTGEEAGLGWKSIFMMPIIYVNGDTQ